MNKQGYLWRGGEGGTAAEVRSAGKAKAPLGTCTETELEPALTVCVVVLTFDEAIVPAYVRSLSKTPRNEFWRHVGVNVML